MEPKTEAKRVDAPTAIMELLEPGPLPVKEIVARSGFSRKTCQKWLAEFTAQGRLQRSKDGPSTLYELVPNGREVVWDWTQFPEWRPADGPAEGIFVNNKPGHTCQFSAKYIGPTGMLSPVGDYRNPEVTWWEAQDILVRYGNIEVGSKSLVEALGRAHYPEFLDGPTTSVLGEIINVARSAMYPRAPYLAPTCIQRTNDKRYPLRLVTGAKIYAAVSFRPGFGPPGEVTKVLLRYRNARMDYGRLHEDELRMIAAMRDRFEEMETLVKGTGK